MEISEIKNRIAKHHGETVKIIESTYVGFKQKATFIDVEFGEWEAHVYAVCRGGRHKQRFLLEKRISFDEAEKRIFEIHEGKISIKRETWKSAGKECIFVDRDFGEWTSLLCNVLHGKGHPERVKFLKSESQKLANAEIQIMLDKLHHGKVILVGPYENAGTKCKFLDCDFGEFEASPTNVLYKGTGHPIRAILRRENTSLKRYGTHHPMQCSSVFSKNQKSQRKNIKINHWKTQQELFCMNSWEAAFVEWCNKNKEDFLWQPKAFKMPNNKTYRPDAFLVERNLWVEIKGWYRDASRIKCEWFKSIMPNFEIWFKDDLINRGIL